MRRARIAIVFTCTALVACGGGETTDDDAMRPTKPRVCIPGDGVTGNPQTIEETVELINSFPKPVSLPCLLESLDRPISLSASSNDFSAQPAFGVNNPRIFIAVGPLVLSVVTKGDSSELLEFGLQRSSSRSLKAELVFPVLEDLESSAPYERVRDADGTGCAFCHLGESRDAEIDFAEAYVSEVIPIDNRDIVELDYLTWSFEQCDPVAEPERCDMFDSIFAQGDVVEAAF
jgi:hypothetical protein